MKALNKFLSGILGIVLIAAAVKGVITIFSGADSFLLVPIGQNVRFVLYLGFLLSSLAAGGSFLINAFYGDFAHVASYCLLGAVLAGYGLKLLAVMAQILGYEAPNDLLGFALLFVLALLGLKVLTGLVDRYVKRVYIFGSALLAVFYAVLAMAAACAAGMLLVLLCVLVWNLFGQTGVTVLLGVLVLLLIAAKLIGLL